MSPDTEAPCKRLRVEISIGLGLGDWGSGFRAEGSGNTWKRSKYDQLFAKMRPANPKDGLEVCKTG